jgi:tritrans,polycis-undecaprenyl-diphosphate synthase [geranylgeranyl-diphosphate specific]
MNDMNPKHVAIILDGNRRFAKRLMLEPWKGHDFGRKKVEELLEWSKELGIKELTFYAFSMQNFNRPKQEFDYLMGIFQSAFVDFLKEPQIDKYKVHLRVIGRYELFPKDVVKALEDAMERTKDYDQYYINFALAYGGREELTDAMKKIAQKVAEGKLKPADVNEKVIQENLYMKSEPDLIIRTGGEKRTSNFLMWQASYSEWFFIDKTWPEFTKEDLISIVEQFKQRERRFGK